jgi:hypothetical protein
MKNSRLSEFHATNCRLKIIGLLFGEYSSMSFSSIDTLKHITINHAKAHNVVIAADHFEYFFAFNNSIDSLIVLGKELDSIVFNTALVESLYLKIDRIRSISFENCVVIGTNTLNSSRSLLPLNKSRYGDVLCDTFSSTINDLEFSNTYIGNVKSDSKIDSLIIKRSVIDNSQNDLKIGSILNNVLTQSSYVSSHVLSNKWIQGKKCKSIGFFQHDPNEFIILSDTSSHLTLDNLERLFVNCNRDIVRSHNWGGGLEYIDFFN